MVRHGDSGSSSSSRAVTRHVDASMESQCWNDATVLACYTKRMMIMIIVYVQLVVGSFITAKTNSAFRTRVGRFSLSRIKIGVTFKCVTLKYNSPTIDLF